MASSGDDDRTYSFGDFTLDLSRGALTQGGRDIRLRPQSFHVLHYLVKNHGRLVAREELLDAVWAGTAVTMGSLTQCVIDIRRATGDSERRMIRTVPRRGFIFDVEVATNGRVAPTRPRSEAHTRGPSIAVLPFSNMSSDSEQDYFCEGMAEELINAINGIGGIKVAGRASAFLFQSKVRDHCEIGRALGVQTVLDGSVRVADSRLRVTVHLIDAESGFDIWTRRFDCNTADVFDIQDEIAESVVNALRSELEPEDHPVRKRHQTTDLEAYNLYLKGQFNWYRREKDCLARAADYFERAAAKDPSYLLAHVGAATAYTSLAFYGARFALTAPKARGALERALALDVGCAEVQAANGMIHHWLDGEPDRAEEDFLRALEHRPDLVMARCWYSFLLSDVGRHDESIACAKETLELDPFSPYIWMSVGMAYAKPRQAEEAINAYEKALELDDQFLSARWMLGLAYVLADRIDDAVTAYEQALQLSGRTSAVLGMLSWAYACAGRRNAAESLIDELRLRMHDDFVAPNFLVWSLGKLGQKDRAFEWLERSCSERDVSLRMLMNTPLYDSLRADPRFDDIIKRFGWVSLSE